MPDVIARNQPIERRLRFLAGTEGLASLAGLVGGIILYVKQPNLLLPAVGIFATSIASGTLSLAHHIKSSRVREYTQKGMPWI